MTYRPRTSPLKHQLIARKRRRSIPTDPSDEDVFAWLMDMGTGKSWVMLDEFGDRENARDLQDMLIVAPAGSYKNWYEDKSDLQQSEINKHLSEDMRERLVVAGWVSGGGAETKRSIERLMRVTDPRRPRALFVNVEALSTVQKVRTLCAEFVRQRRAIMGVDESTTIKGHRSERSKAVRLIGEGAAARRIMTGLPTPRSPLDLYAQYEFLDWRILGHRSYRNFMHRYAVTKSTDFGGKLRRPTEIVVGYRNVAELHDLIAPYSYRVLKKDCLDLPPKVYAPFREVEMTKEQRRAYSELLEYATTQLDSGEHVTAEMTMQQVMKRHQVLCGYVKDENGVTHEIPTKRPDSLVELLGEHEGKAIIWAPYDFCIRAISDRLGKEFGPRSYARFWGGNRSTRGEEERRFLGDPDCRFMVATPGAGGRGNTWTVANLVVYYASLDNLEHRDQSEDRPHRHGQTESVLYVDMVVRGTVEERIVKSLRKKIDIAAAITGDGPRAWLI